MGFINYWEAKEVMMTIAVVVMRKRWICCEYACTPANELKRYLATLTKTSSNTNTYDVKLKLSKQNNDTYNDIIDDYVDSLDSTSDLVQPINTVVDSTSVSVEPTNTVEDSTNSLNLPIVW